MISSLYECKVTHKRSSPKVHRFEYGVFFFCLDLDELDEISNNQLLVKKNRLALYSFFEEDYINESRSACKAKVVNFVASSDRQLASKIHRVKLLTGLRILGYVFNPVSIYYCLDRNGALLCALAEVTNTFREVKLYLVLDSSGASERQVLKATLQKFFYVSPFSNLDTFFEFIIKEPEQTVALTINTIENDSTTLVSTVVGNRVPLCSSQLLRLTLRYPLMSIRTISLIHLHALRLFLKGIPFITKEANPHLQTMVNNPHKSLTGGQLTSSRSVFLASSLNSEIDETAS